MLDKILLVLAFSMLVIQGCSNLDLDPINTRFKENAGNSLTQPANITVADPNNFSFVVMGDTHVGSPAGGTLNQIAARAQSNGDAFILVTGDISHGGQLGEFRQFKSTLTSYGVPFRVAIGNHDLFFGGWDNFKSEMGKSMYSVVAGSMKIIFLDSGNAQLGEEQLNWLEYELKNTTQPLKVVVSHFSPYVDPSFVGSYYVMESEEESVILKDMLHRYNVQLFFGGHYHGFSRRKLGNTDYVITGAANDLIDLGNKQGFVRVTVSGGVISSLVNINL